MSALPVVGVPGLRAEDLGCYLASLGLHRVAARRWPAVRAAWHLGRFTLVGGPETLEALAAHVARIGEAAAWTPYLRAWTDAQRKDARTVQKLKGASPTEPLALALHANDVSEDDARLLAAHVVTRRRPIFNPLLGSAGNSGRREFAKGFAEAVAAIRGGAARRRKKAGASAVLDPLPFLKGEAHGRLGDWQGLSWFASPEISPYAMVLACEGLRCFAGAPSRRLGSRASPEGAFPFVTAAAAPLTAGENGRDRAEVWVPIFERPMTVPEVEGLFSRGRAEVGGRGARRPGAFAAAILGRGVDAGLSEFVRFGLGATTSGHTFEPRLYGRVAVPRPDAASGPIAAHAQAMRCIVELLDRLPRDRGGRKKRFEGLAGPVEGALCRSAERPEDPQAFAALLDAVLAALDRVDRNLRLRKAFRDARGRLPLLPGEAAGLFIGAGSDPEMRLGLALASLGAKGRGPRFLEHRLGVKIDRGIATLPEAVPARRVLGLSPPVDGLIAVLRRRLTDAGPDAELPFHAAVAAPLQDVLGFIAGAVDNGRVVRWASRFALFDLSRPADRLRQGSRSHPPADGALALHALLWPLFTPREIRFDGGRTDDGLFGGSPARTTLAAARIAALLARGDVGGAVDVARVRYLMARRPLAVREAPVHIGDPRRFLPHCSSRSRRAPSCRT